MRAKYRTRRQRSRVRESRPCCHSCSRIYSFVLVLEAAFVPCSQVLDCCGKRICSQLTVSENLAKTAPLPPGTLMSYASIGRAFLHALACSDVSAAVVLEDHKRIPRATRIFFSSLAVEDHLNPEHTA